MFNAYKESLNKKICRRKKTVMLYGWGDNSKGQLGTNENFLDNPKEIQFQQDVEIKQIACGENHTLVLTKSGIVYSIGDDGGTNNVKGKNSENCNNDNNNSFNNTWKRITMLETHMILQISCGVYHSVVLNDKNELFAWGSNARNQIGNTFNSDKTHVPKLVKLSVTGNIILLVCGGYHTLVLTDLGEIFAFGNNDEGQLGFIDSRSSSLSSSSVDQQQQQQQLDGGELTCLKSLPIRHIACGEAHNFILTYSGALFCFGKNEYGQLGLGDNENRKFPVHCKHLRNSKVVYVSCGRNHTVALTIEGGIFTWGYGEEGQLGHNSFLNINSPRKCFDLMGEDVSQIACGINHTLVYLNNSKKILFFGRLGNLQKHAIINSPTPVKIPSNKNNFSLKCIYAGGYRNFILYNNNNNTIIDNNSSDNSIETIDMRQMVYSCCKNKIKFLGIDDDFLKSVLNKNEKDEEKKSTIDDQVVYDIRRTFGNVSYLNKSFLTKQNLHFNCSGKNCGIDLDESSLFWEKINTLERSNKALSQAIEGVICQMIKTLKQFSNPPDMECLRVYLILPTCHLFSNLDKYLSFHVELAKCMNCLKEMPSMVINRWWTNMATRHFNKIVVQYKECVLKLMKNKTPESFNVVCLDNLIPCLEILKRAHTINVDTHKINYEKFYIPELKSKINLPEDYRNWILSSLHDNVSASASSKKFSFCFYSFLFDPLAKSTLLQVDANMQMATALEEVQRRNFAQFLQQPNDPKFDTPFLFLQINRDRLVEDTLNSLASPFIQLKKPLRVKFLDEEGQDEGGITKEFFLLIIKEVLDPGYGMFKHYQESRLLWFSSLSFEGRGMFLLIGMLCGLAIYNSQIVDLPFPLALYKKLLTKSINLDDLKELDPVLGKSLEEICDYEQADDFDDVFQLTWSISMEAWGELQIVALIENGDKKGVTYDDRKKYVDAYVNYVLNKNVQSQYDAFAEGFYKVANGKVWQLMEAEELRAMVAGNENYEWDVFKETAEYRGVFWAKHPTIDIFWTVFLKRLTEANRRAFLKFLTGSDRIPIQGMNTLKIVFQPANVDEKYLPVAHTCFNVLDLPLYQNEETMLKQLLTAIECNQGFGLV